MAPLPSKIYCRRCPQASALELINSSPSFNRRCPACGAEYTYSGQFLGEYNPTEMDKLIERDAPDDAWLKQNEDALRTELHGRGFLPVDVVRFMLSFHMPDTVRVVDEEATPCIHTPRMDGIDDRWAKVVVGQTEEEDARRMSNYGE